MSIVYGNLDWCFIDHYEFVTKIYESVSVTCSEKTSFKLLQKLFSYRSDKSIIDRKNNRKRPSESEYMLTETQTVREKFNILLEHIPEDVIINTQNKFNLLIAADVRDLAKSLFEETLFDQSDLNGGNNSEYPLKCSIKNREFLIPPHCRFLCGDIKEQCSKLRGNKYDIVIADPPWWNKFIRRLKSANQKLSYSMMYNEDIASIQVKDLFSDNTLIAVWCTNAPSNIDAVKNLIFPKWGVQYITTWYWLKVTTDLEPVCAFSTGVKKQPYERLILGKVGDIKEIPNEKLFVSVPSALHSHKPPLIDLLSPYISTEQPSTLELFARYLLPHTTSVGYEPLKWQHTSLYECDS